jgi:hypothetical protein
MLVIALDLKAQIQDWVEEYPELEKDALDCVHWAKLGVIKDFLAPFH